MVAVTEQVRIGGVWLNDIAPWGDLSYSSLWGDGGGGCDEASVGIYLRPGRRDDRFRRGAPFEVFSGGTRIWLGSLGQADWTQGVFTADGLYKRAGDFQALDGSGNATAVANTAIDQAIADGLEWSRPSSISAAALTGTQDNLNTLSALLTMVGDRDGKRWAVWEDGAVTMAVDPTVPTWRIAPGLIEFGEDDTTYASVLKVRYINSADSTYTTVTVTDQAAADRFGVVQAPVNLVDLGPISTATATSYGNGILAKARSKMGWRNSVDVGRYQLTTMGGLPADPSMVKAGQVVRAVGLYDPLAGSSYSDLVIGRVNRNSTDRALTLAPVDTQPQTLEDAIAAVMTAALNKPFAA